MTTKCQEQQNGSRSRVATLGKIQRINDKCANCGHDIMVYHHPLGSAPLIFHNNGGIFNRVCDCGCEKPVIDNKNK